MCKLLNLLIATGLKASIIFGLASYMKILTSNKLTFFLTMFAVIFVLDIIVSIVMTPFESFESHPELATRERRVSPQAMVLAYAHKYGHDILERNDLTKDQQIQLILKRLRQDLKRQNIKYPFLLASQIIPFPDLAQQLKLFDYDHYERGDAWSDNTQAGRTFYPKSDMI